MKRLLALLLMFALLLSACGPAEKSSAASLPEAPPPETSSGEPEPGLPALPAPSEDTAKALTRAVLERALYPGAADGWQGEAGLVDLHTFCIWAGVEQWHPYREWFPLEEETGLHCYPEEALRRMVWEIFGFEELPWKGDEFLEWNEGEERWESTLEFGTRWPSFEAEGEMTAVWQDDATLTVSTGISQAGSVNGEPGFLPLGDALFTYRRMSGEGREFLRLEKMEIEKYPEETVAYSEYRYNTVPGVTIPDTPIGKLVRYDGYVGSEYTITSPSAIQSVLELWGKVRVLEAPVEPPTPERPFGMTYTRFFAGEEDETPVFTLYENPFCVEVGEERSGFYLLDDSDPEEERGILHHIFCELDGTILKSSWPMADDMLLFQIPFRGRDGERRTLNFFFPSDWAGRGDAIVGPGEKTVSFAAYYPDSPAWEEISGAFIDRETQWVLPRSCWITEETDGAFATRRYFFYEKGIYYQLAFSQNTEKYPLAVEQLDEMLRYLVYIQHRGPDEMADVVLEEQEIVG